MNNSVIGSSHLERSYLIQRRGMALLAAAFPCLFLVSTFILERTPFQRSISAYYHTLDLERNLFVGVLFAIAVFLILYKGYRKLEDYILDIAGISIAGVALCPTDKVGDSNGYSLSAHSVFALVFFVCIFIVCVFMSEETLKHVQDEDRKRSFRRLYRICAGVMIVAVALAVISQLFSEELVHTLHIKSALFWFEAVGVWAFSAFWYIKTREIDPGMSWVPFRSKRVATHE
jgi:hypothetical protein